MDNLRRLELRDGRLLDVRLHGPDTGPALVFHHGTPGAATPLRALSTAAEQRGLQLITTSRPGYGGSTRHAGRRVVDVVDDIDQVLDALGRESCLVAGWSGGGPHALACAERLDRALSTLVIAGVAPFDAPGLDFLAGMGDDNLDEFGAALQGEPELRAYLDAQRRQLESADAPAIVDSMRSLLPPVDREVLTETFGEDLASSFHEALRVGVDGWLDDDLAFTAPWGFELDEIEGPVSIWQGSVDLMVPYTHGQWLGRSIPDVTAHLRDGEGHLSVLLGSMGEMLDELVQTSGLS